MKSTSQQRERDERVAQWRAAGAKPCSRCKETKPLSEFRWEEKRRTYGSWCRACVAFNGARWHQNCVVAKRPPKVPIPAGHKRCPNCECVKPVTDFYKCRTSKDGLQGRCIPCSTIQRWAWRLSNPDRTRELGRRNARKQHYRQRYGIAVKEIAAWIEASLRKQEGRCAICLRPFSSELKHCVDHDHSTGALRALLCNPCNSSLGMMREDAAAILRMIDYLDAHSKGSESGLSVGTQTPSK